jgi:hypothetical protein
MEIKAASYTGYYGMRSLLEAAPPDGLGKSHK